MSRVLLLWQQEVCSETPSLVMMQNFQLFLTSSLWTAATNSKYSRLLEDDKDLGGQCPSSHYMFIENFERNLLPSSFRDFIYEHTSVPSQAYILPCPFMPYARGIIVVDSEDKRQKILQFLDNPAHLIVSSTGRYDSCIQFLNQECCFLSWCVTFIISFSL